ALTGADVAYTINLAKTNPGVGYSSLVPEGLIGATASGNTVTVTFKSPAPYAAWQYFLWNNPILPQSIWSALSSTEQLTGANLTPIGSGPMTLVATNTTGGAAGLGEQCYQDNPNWWAIKDLGLSFKFKYLCDAVNGSNSVELSALLSGNLDWSNNFLPGINSLMVTGGDTFLKTYYPKTPYMLSANTTWLELNTAKAPMSNLNFRKAVAYGVNPQAIVTGDYDGIVAPANPTGLLPNLDSYIDQSVVKQYGYSYNPALAKKYLAESGYKGQTLSLMVPTGWSDWVAAVQIIATELESIGIHISLIYPEANTKTSDEDSGNYDMCLDNNAQASSDPYSYFDRVFQLPIGGKTNEEAAGLNLERFSDPGAWSTLEQAAVTNPNDTAKVNALYGQLEADFLQNLPEIPLWYNGAWFQGNTTYWTNYPSSTNPDDQNTPVLWFSWLGATTTVFALADLRPAH
ncbi:MAG TPA: ABC transporter substrate-binding protein, partial [Acidimicrobiales bacterium]|nr:ABC transporter substrate-binding protein [Acidimicrobiales bacterium]